MSLNPQIILASKSSARAKLLSQINIPFKVIPSEINEYEFDDRFPPDPKKYVLNTSYKKAIAIISQLNRQVKETIIIGCDTIIVSSSNVIIGKPKSRNESKILLQNFSGKSHQVLTGCTVIVLPSNTKYQTIVSTLVKFRKITDEEIDYYLEKCEWKNRAGGYAIQGIGAFLVDKIEGDFYSVVGLPISWLWETFWHHFGKKFF